MLCKIHWPAGLVLIAALVSGLSGCAVNPVTGKNELSLVSEAQELAIGKQQYLPSQQVQGGDYRIDPELSRYVSEVGQRLAAVSDRPLPYEFVVLNNSTPNAWALPGGKIAVNRGLLVELNNEAELAAVLGHEIVHAAAKHGAAAMSRGMLVQGALLAGNLAFADHAQANVILGSAALGAQLITQKYSRDAESESDFYGMHYMVKAGYDPKAAISLQETFVRLSEDRSAGWMQGLFASHPPSRERVEANRQTAATFTSDGRLFAARYQEKLALLQSRLSAYQAADDAQKSLADKQIPQALQTIDRALNQLPIEARFYALKGDIRLAGQEWSKARTNYDRAIDRDPGWYHNYLGRGLAEVQLGRLADARSDLELSNRIVPSAIATNELGKIALRDNRRTDAKRYFQAASGAGGRLGQDASYAFTRLDIEDNPSKYVTVAMAADLENKLVLQISNPTGISLEHINLQLIKGNSPAGSLTIARLNAGERTLRTTRIRLGSEEELADYRAQVLAASVGR